jgi:hypothetical protein
MATASRAAEQDAWVDFASAAGTIKRLHGVNGSPVVRGENADLVAYHAAAGFPHTRLHDVHWPHPDAVDVSTIFPLFHADPDDPKNYTFAKTDDIIAAVVKNGSQVVFRLGESIEPWTNHRNHPPQDFAKWAKVCVNIARHYNDGWADGHRYGIKYWEVWNEPESAMMWSGTQKQYFDLYEITARALKAHDPTLRVGGPAATDPDGPWVAPFLTYCRDRKVPLDFFSWHLYRGTPGAVVEAATKARKTLDAAGFVECESHLNEWRYWTTWAWLRPNDSEKYPEVRANFAASVGTEGAGFAIATLIALQDAKLDVANFYTADTSAWGMFDSFGVPSRTYRAFQAFNELTRTPGRVACKGPYRHGVTIAAGLAADRKYANVLIACFKSAGEPLSVALEGLPWEGRCRVAVRRIDDAHDPEDSEELVLDTKDAVLRLKPAPNGVYLVKLQQ